MTELLHLTERETWEAALPTGWYRTSTRGVSLEQQGFIHCSLPHQLRGVAEFVYRDATEDLVVLVIDSERLDAPVKYEAMEPGADEFPHIYGPVPASAVSRVVPVERDDQGRMLLPE
ncbi:hypothetical protein GCM10010168_26060 [Actinoplanes ianthinogenes]|uniref:DUF952 domain-containing protein n=1 Tax=Actinoplanes ianthinogenes TaxID=122358 RepID=A0ABM7M9B3_9ACTN|nr:DUF952 domain-containing protein [Actinoplanes ianthinogenes]BCJ48246.1 hypothetical protein Aiant_89030 [Actinoplanes ianthinogenes]GGR07402.1 hypothetical protein GCM10010168_26060 [Actinoplanes ianthinogenes]